MHPDLGRSQRPSCPTLPFAIGYHRAWLSRAGPTRGGTQITPIWTPQLPEGPAAVRVQDGGSGAPVASAGRTPRRRVGVLFSPVRAVRAKTHRGRQAPGP